MPDTTNWHDKLFSNGCSFLGSRPVANINTFTTKILAQEYNLQLFNIARGGRGNDRISFTTKAWFEQNNINNGKIMNKDVVAVIGWSNQFRNDYITTSGRPKDGKLPWRTFKIEDIEKFNLAKYQKDKFSYEYGHWDIENTGIMKLLDHIFDLQNYFKLKKIPYIFYNALPNYLLSDIPDFKTVYNAIDLKRFYKPETSHYEFCIKKKLFISKEDTHPNTEGHRQWALLLKKYIDDNNLFHEI